VKTFDNDETNPKLT